MPDDAPVNQQLPGNPRYQPKELKDFFGYDKLYHWYVLVEVATLKALGEIDVISATDMALLTPDIEDSLHKITTTQVDEIERSLTQHDVRALVNIIKSKLPSQLAKWVHVPLTSYDVVEPARILMFSRAYSEATRPLIKELVRLFTAKVRQYSSTVQIGRTHGQAALPITVGFWLATILSRILDNWSKLDQFHSELVAKLSGAVGAKNAQVGLGIEKRSGEISFEHRVLRSLGLKPARISTQVLAPEPLAFFLYAHVTMAGALAQFARDCRHLMRTEIGEIQEYFASTQTGSSTMAHKRNPLNFENIDGTYTKIVAEFLKVQMTAMSEHQRDLTGSCVARDLPTIVVDLHLMLNTLLRKNKENNKTFLENINVNEQAIKKNLEASSHLVIAEPLYIALQMYGYEGDAHHLVNQQLTPQAAATGKSLVDILVDEHLATDPALQTAWANIPQDIKNLLSKPESYTGNASVQALAIADLADTFLN